tara:strand:- start:252 stop:1301 length:1050 start_codon:yes stop_codon:yes gene_type:complete
VAEGESLLLAGRVEEQELLRQIKVLSELVTAAPDDERVHLHLARMAEATQRDDIAATSYRNAFEINPELKAAKLTPGLLVARGRWNLDAHRETAALLDYGLLGESRHRIAGLPSRLYAQLLLASGDFERALAALGKDQEPADRRLRCEILRRQGRLPEALAALDPKDARVATALCRARVLRQLGRLAEAERLLRAILALEVTVEAGLRIPTALRYYVADVERYERQPKFLAVTVAFAPERLGERDLMVRYRISAPRSLQIVNEDFKLRVERRPDIIALEARVELARVLCRASRKLKGKERSDALAAAVQELSQAVDGGLHDLESFHNDPDLARLRQRKSFQDLIRRARR